MSNRKAVTVQVVQEGGLDLTAGTTYVVEPCGTKFRDDLGDLRLVRDMDRYRIGYEFKPGDRVHYHNSLRSTGTVIKHSRPTNVDVDWDHPDSNCPWGVYPQNLILIKEAETVTAPTNRINAETQFNYVIFNKERADCVNHRPYAVNGNRAELIDDGGDRQDVYPTQEGVVGCAPIEFIIRTLDAPNKTCIGKYVSAVPNYETGDIKCQAEHKTQAHRFTFEQVVEFLQFARRKFEAGKHSEFEVLLEPVRVGNGVVTEKRSTAGRRVGDTLLCVLAGRRELLVGQTYKVVSIDGDGDEFIEPVRPEAHTREQLTLYPSLAAAPVFTRGSQFEEVR